jgi:hypothetical protein
LKRHQLTPKRDILSLDVTLLLDENLPANAALGASTATAIRTAIKDFIDVPFV